MQESGELQHHSMGTSSSQSMAPRQEFAYPQEQPVGSSSSQVRQAATADDLHPEHVPSQRTQPTGDARLDLSQSAEEDISRAEGIESSGPVPQQEMSFRDLASAGSASEPASNGMDKLDPEPMPSRSSGMTEQAGSHGASSQLSFTPQPQQQQQQQPTQQLRRQLSGNPFQAAAMAADAPAGDGQTSGRFTGIPTAASTAPAAPDNPFASPAAPDDARRGPLLGDSKIPGRGAGLGAASRSQSGVVPIPHQQSGTLSVPEQHEESSGAEVQAERAAGQAVAGSLDPSLQGNCGTEVSMPGSSMCTATSIAQLLADLPPAGM